MQSQTPPRNLRTILLATPKKTRRSKKFVPPVFTGKINTGVRPGAISGPLGDNWRIKALATPPLRRLVDPTLSLFRQPGPISQSTLLGKCTPRTDDLAIPPLRVLRIQQKVFSREGSRLTPNIDKQIDKSWKSMYHFYERRLMEIKKKRQYLARLRKGKSKKGSKQGIQKGGKPGKPKTPKQIMDEKLKKFDVWAATAAQPRRVFLPKPRKPRKIADLKKIANHMSKMARPTSVTRKYIRPSIDPNYVDPLRVSAGARSYTISERVNKLAACPPHRLKKEPVFKPGAVKRSALTCEVSPRFLELAIPRKTAKEKDTEFRDDAFEISRNALKYKPTPRILELAKPSERQ